MGGGQLGSVGPSIRRWGGCKGSLSPANQAAGVFQLLQTAGFKQGNLKTCKRHKARAQDHGQCTGCALHKHQARRA